MMATPGSHDRGAVLVETLIAAAIMAMITGALLSLVSAHTNRGHKLQEQQEAMLTAQSRLAQIGTLIPRSLGRTTGVDNEYNWTVELTRYNQALITSEAGQLAHVRVTVRKSDKANILAQLETLQLIPAR